MPVSPSETTFSYIAVDPDGSQGVLDLADVSAGVFERALENVVFLRAQTGGGLSRLNFRP